MIIPNLEAFRAGQLSYADMTGKISYADLHQITDELFETINAIVADATDAAVVFEPKDSALTNEDEHGWTLGHVIVHFTASLEETAALSSTLARGIAVEGRSRYETPWETIKTAQQVQERLKESYRMCRAFLEAWPTTPHLDLTVVRIPRFGPMNAIGLYILGTMHGIAHLDQLREIMQQVKD